MTILGQLFSCSVQPSHLGRGAEQSIQRLQHGRGNAPQLQGLQQSLSWQVSYQLVLSEWTPTQPADGAIKTPAPRIVSRQSLFYGLIGTTVEVHANIEVSVFLHHRANQIADLLRRRHANCVGQ